MRISSNLIILTLAAVSVLAFVIAGGCGNGTTTPGVPMCAELGGLCSDVDALCPDGYFPWAALECEGDRETTIYCLPIGDCAAIGGYCEDRSVACISGFGANEPMNCDNSDSSKCCVPYIPGGIPPHE
jgi:hypothetical protein